MSGSEYHYTLYYYDQAGNLVKTVPPAGVHPNRSAAWLADVQAKRAAGQEESPAHTLVTQYRYNTLNQVTTQHTPDANSSMMWYDRLGRLVISQNAKQKLADNVYSYTLYDTLGRITEVGEITGDDTMSVPIARNPAMLNQWMTNGADARTQITQTVYDDQYSPINPGMNAKNLRSRVSYTKYFTVAASMPAEHQSATYYSYDIHGNVDTLYLDYKGIAGMSDSNRFKKIVYRYDLISGKVNSVAYQPGRQNPDAFYHRYYYDAENRLTGVETSSDSIVWEREASYTYYKHGPLAQCH